MCVLQIIHNIRTKILSQIYAQDITCTFSAWMGVGVGKFRIEVSFREKVNVYSE